MGWLNYRNLWFATAAFVAGACTGPASQGRSGESCFRDAECRPGLVCVAQSCSDDLTEIESIGAGPVDEPALVDGGSEAGDSSLADSGSEAGLPDTGAGGSGGAGAGGAAGANAGDASAAGSNNGGSPPVDSGTDGG